MNLEATALKQITYYPQYRELAKLILKPVVFGGKAGAVSHAEVFQYITHTEGDLVDIIKHFDKPELTMLLVSADDLPSFYHCTPLIFFQILEQYVMARCLDVVGAFPADHFREECYIFLNSEVDFFEKLDTLQNFLKHYSHPGLLAIEEIALVLDEKIRKLKSSMRAAQLIKQAAAIMKLHHNEAEIDALTQPLIDIC